MTIFTQILDLGPRAGLRVAVKDTIDVAGVPTRAGSRALAEAPPAGRHAEVVERLLAAGCRIVGKTTLHELAFGVTGINEWTGTPVNPRFPELVPGGSSSGSAAAVAAGLADIALGTDTGGSIRIPAACCGVWGLKPSFGRVGRAGVMPSRTTLDCVGPLADSWDGLVRAMELLDPSFGRETVITARLGVLQVPAAPHVAAAIGAALSRSGMDLVPARLDGLDAAFEAGLHVIAAETWNAVSALSRSGAVGADVQARLLQAATVDATALAQAEAVRSRFTAEVDRLLDRVDALALPTLADRPPTLAEGRANRSAVALTRYVRPFNLSGHPALAIPVAGGRAGPVSLQLVGRRGDDARLCGIAAALAQGWPGPADRSIPRFRHEKEERGM